MSCDLLLKWNCAYITRYGNKTQRRKCCFIIYILLSLPIKYIRLIKRCYVYFIFCDVQSDEGVNIFDPITAQ